ncbi:MAG: hypothetical protein M9928_18050 [Anaerolineae bacterium]|nr:hypothetical protein [Anaerolineae bacterium]MCO5189066.1 hypothetical protein [Anaerolineae bacterium]MCO5206919.1 hypothetical protein [Anaerolineae bacterium]
MKTGLLVGVRTKDLGLLVRTLTSDQVRIHVAISFEEMVRICAQGALDFVFLGSDLDPACKLKTFEYIVSVSPATQIHVMGQDGDPVRFVTGILN